MSDTQNSTPQQGLNPPFTGIPADIKHVDILDYVEDDRVRALLGRMPQVTNYGNIIFYSCRVAGNTLEEYQQAHERGKAAVAHHLTEAFEHGVFDDRTRMHAPVIDMAAGKTDEQFAARVLIVYIQLPDDVNYREVLEVLPAYRHVTQTNDPAEV